jgi:hypothetical protein
MEQVTFKTLDTKAVHEKLLKVADRILVVREVIDKWNDVENCSVLPILGDAEQELGEVYGDLQLNGRKEAPTKKTPLKILQPKNKDKKRKEGDLDGNLSRVPKVS